jgi:hypothetical protein
VRAKSERVERRLEGKLPPFSSIFFVIFLRGAIAIKKKMTAMRRHLLLWFLL